MSTTRRLGYHCKKRIRDKSLVQLEGTSLKSTQLHSLSTVDTTCHARSVTPPASPSCSWLCDTFPQGKRSCLCSDSTRRPDAACRPNRRAKLCHVSRRVSELYMCTVR